MKPRLVLFWVGVLALVAGGGQVRGQSAPASAVLVGAIRWDGWYKSHDPRAQNSVPAIVEKNLSFPRYRFRVPYFAEMAGRKVSMPYITQELIDREIALARDAGIDYWAYCWYRDDGSGLADARLMHMKSARANDVKLCAMLENGHFHTDADIAALVADFKRDNYLKVAEGRPLVFFFDANDQTAGTILRLRKATASQGLPEPYVAMMGHRDPCANADQAGADAVSRYVTLGQDQEAYASLATRERRSWDEFRDRGKEVIPIVTAGWDPRPRIGRTPWGVHYCKTCWAETATAEEIADQIVAGIRWVNSNPQAGQASCILIYAWNEYDEGGWIAPVLQDYVNGQLIPERLNAISSVLLDAK